MFGGSPLRNLERPSLSPCCDLDYVIIGVMKYVILQDGTDDEDMYEDTPPLEEFTDDEDKGEVRLNQILCWLDLKPASSWRLSLIELFPHL